jgi:flagellar basal-body rod protein FlgB
MALDGLFTDGTAVVLGKRLDAAGLRQRVIADNIANVETPGFTRSEVAFEDSLREAVRAGNDESLASRAESVEPEVRVDRSSPARPDGNNVSIDKEMADMTKNTLEYEAIVQLMTLRGSMLRSAITGGR